MSIGTTDDIHTKIENIPLGVQYNLKISNRDDGQILNVKIKNITVEQFQTLLVAIA